MNRRDFLKMTGLELSVLTTPIIPISSKEDINKENKSNFKKIKIGKEAYLKVEDLGPGIFSNERLLGYRKMRGIFDKSNIKNGRLRVTVDENKPKGEDVGVIVPEFFEDYGCLVCVKKSDLKYAV